MKVVDLDLAIIITPPPPLNPPLTMNTYRSHIVHD